MHYNILSLPPQHIQFWDSENLLMLNQLQTSLRVTLSMCKSVHVVNGKKFWCYWIADKTEEGIEVPVTSGKI